MLRRSLRRLAAKADPYKVLGVNIHSSAEDIKRAHRVLALKHHPDVNGGDGARFQEIQAAFEELKSRNFQPPVEAYDGEGAAGSSGSSGMDGFNPDGTPKARGNYVQNKWMQAVLRIVLVWSLGFVVLRILLTRLVFPPTPLIAQQPHTTSPPPPQPPKSNTATENTARAPLVTSPFAAAETSSAPTIDPLAPRR